MIMMTYQSKRKLYAAILIAGLFGCDGISNSPSMRDSFIDPDLGPTEMTRCAILSGSNINMGDVVARLSDFAIDEELKILDERADGRNGTYLQVDDPYVVLQHAYFSQRNPPEHMFVSFRSPNSKEGQSIEDAFFSLLLDLGPLKPCNGFQSSITPGWRLVD